MSKGNEYNWLLPRLSRRGEVSSFGFCSLANLYVMLQVRYGRWRGSRFEGLTTRMRGELHGGWSVIDIPDQVGCGTEWLSRLIWHIDAAVCGYIVWFWLPKFPWFAAVGDSDMSLTICLAHMGWGRSLVRASAKFSVPCVCDNVTVPFWVFWQGWCCLMPMCPVRLVFSWCSATYIALWLSTCSGVAGS